ncbi:hypothetical protein BH23ACT11_BH23ACT11_08690 [soil metagenome]
MRERVAFGILVMIMIFLFAFVFAVLGRGEYDPSAEEGLTTQPAITQTLA